MVYDTPTVSIEDEPTINEELDRPKLKIKSISRFGVVEIIFSEMLFVPKDPMALNENDIEL